VAHGLVNAILLAHVLRWNADAIPDDVKRIGEALAAGASTAAGDAADAADAVDSLRGRVGLPGRLSEVGVDEDDIEAVVRMSSGNANIARNPRPVSPEDVRSLLESAF
jgi:alcohol dehydrogenase class IV